MKIHAAGGKTARLLLSALAVAVLAAVITLSLSAPSDSAHVLRWITGHWLNAVAITAAATVLTALIQVVTLRLDRRRASYGAGRAARERAAMLLRVRNMWISGVLEPSTAGTAPLAIGLRRRPGLLGRDEEAPYLQGHPVLAREDKPILTVFDEASQALLILGAPGAGKTTLLLELAGKLLERAERDGRQPIPVVFHLTSWAAQGQPLAAWLAGELAASYMVPAHAAEAWVTQDALAVLLDGLDEVAGKDRAACVQAINDYRHDHGLVPIAVCSRTRELDDLVIRLDLDEAVELQPLTDSQITSYLSDLQPARTPVTGMGAAILTDKGLRDLLRSPLMLHVITLAYQGQTASAPLQPGSTEEQQQQLWAAYIQRMFQQRPLDPRCGYTQRQALGWLAWLAHAMRDRNQAEFHLDRLTDGWVPDPPRIEHPGIFPLKAIRAYRETAELRARRQAENLHWPRKAPFSFRTLLTVGMLSALFGFLADVVGRLLPVQPGAGYAWVVGVGTDALIMLLVFSCIWYTKWFSISRQIVRHHLRPAEELHWSLKALFRFRLWLSLLIPMLLSGLLGGLRTPTAGLVAALLTGLLLGPLIALFGGLSIKLREKRTSPNEGTRRSLKNGFLVGLPAGLYGGLVSFLSSAVFVPSVKWQAGVTSFLLFSYLGVLSFGGYAFLLNRSVRAKLRQAGIAPRHYETFLDAMAERLILRRSGSAYLFAHQLLRDYLADLNNTTKTR